MQPRGVAPPIGGYIPYAAAYQPPRLVPAQYPGVMQPGVVAGMNYSALAMGNGVYYPPSGTATTTSATGVSTTPQPLLPPPPRPWQMVRDTTSGMPYYYNTETGATQWHFPSPAQEAMSLPLSSQPGSTQASPAIPMPDPQAEPEAYEAWKAVMEHVRGGVASKMTGRELDVPPRPRLAEKVCLDFQAGRCYRGSACKFAHQGGDQPESPRLAPTAAPVDEPDNRERSRRRRRRDDDGDVVEDDEYRDRRRRRDDDYDDGGDRRRIRDDDDRSRSRRRHHRRDEDRDRSRSRRRRDVDAVDYLAGSRDD